MKDISLKYRPDIDGLRAIAVLSVIVFHINASWMPNGYLGVDVFFVISGFLITSIIKKKIESRNFSLINFYKKRALRILPAFIFYICCTTIAAYLLFTPSDFNNLYVRSLFFSIFFSANLYFAKGGSYFDIDIHERPLLHICSLSVEEQFYFIFPISLFLCIRFFPKRIITSISVLILVSLGCFFMPTFGLDSYFLPHVRAYEILIGSLVACLSIKTLKNNLYIVLFLIPLFIVFFLPKGCLLGHGYIERVIVCFCVGGLILYRPNDKDRFNVLSLKPLVSIGLISYSLYLWHWGVLSFSRYIYMDYNLPNEVIAMSLFVMLAMSIFSYHYVEKIFRFRKLPSNKKFILFLGIYFFTGATCLIYALFVRNHDVRSIPLLNANSDSINLDWDKSTCHNKIDNCTLGNQTGTASVLVYGDSHAAQYSRFIDYIGKKEKWKADLVSADACRFSLSSPKEPNISQRCINIKNYVLGRIEQYDTFVVANYWEQAQQADGKFLKKLEQDFQYFNELDKRVIVFKDNPVSNKNPLRVYIQQSMGIFVHDFNDIKLSNSYFNDDVKKIIDKYPNVVWVDTTQFIPPNLLIDGKPIYKDMDHINPYGSKKLAEKYYQNGLKIVN